MNISRINLRVYWTCKAQREWLRGEYQQAVWSIEKAKRMIKSPTR